MPPLPGNQDIYYSKMRNPFKKQVVLIRLTVPNKVCGCFTAAEQRQDSPGECCCTAAHSSKTPPGLPSLKGTKAGPIHFFCKFCSPCLHLMHCSPPACCQRKCSSCLRSTQDICLVSSDVIQEVVYMQVCTAPPLLHLRHNNVQYYYSQTARNFVKVPNVPGDFHQQLHSALHELAAIERGMQ